MTAASHPPAKGDAMSRPAPNPKVSIVTASQRQGKLIGDT